MEHLTQKPSCAWLTLWVRPRQTLRMLLEKAPTANILWLAFVHGLIVGLYWVQTVGTYHPHTAPSLLYLLCMLIGAGVGIFQLYFVAWLYLFCGRWLGGTGSYRDLKCAVGWSFYPFIIAGLFGLLSGWTIPHVWIQGFLSLLSVTAFIWGIVTVFKLVAEAHLFSAWRSIVTVILAIFFSLLFIFILNFIIALFI